MTEYISQAVINQSLFFFGVFMFSLGIVSTLRFVALGLMRLIR